MNSLVVKELLDVLRHLKKKRKKRKLEWTGGIGSYIDVPGVKHFGEGEGDSNGSCPARNEEKNGFQILGCIKEHHK